MAEYEKGAMDISAHQHTWAGFTKLVTWSTVSLVTVVLLLIFIFG